MSSLAETFLQLNSIEMSSFNLHEQYVDESCWNTFSHFL